MRVRHACLATALSLCIVAVAAPSAAQRPDRSKPPELGPLPTLKLPAIQRFSLSNGLNVVLMEKHEVPLVEVDLIVNAGSAMNPADKPGVASMTAEMMDEGAGNRSALELSDAVDFLGASLTVGAGWHTSVVQLNTPVSKLDSAMLLMADVALRPRFAADELERKRVERLTAFTQWRDEPRQIASVLFNRTLFGTRHPYGIPSAGDPATVRALTPADLKGFYDTYYRPNNAMLVVVGDVTPATIRPRLEAAFGRWLPGPQPKAEWPEVKQVARREILLVNKPGAEQSEIRIGRIGAARSTPDYYALVVMNTILGGSFTSRLNQNLRETHQYSYGASSGFDFRKLAGPFLAAAAVQTSVTDSALTEFMKELRGIVTAVSDEELTRAKNYVALGFPSDFQSVGSVAGQLAALVTYNLPDDYFTNFIPRILAVTKEDVQRVARQYIDPERVAVIVVGDRQKIERGVRALNLGPVRVLSIDDVLGRAGPETQ